MDWLNPQMVEEWLKNLDVGFVGRPPQGPYAVALEQFVLAFADPAKPTTVHEASQMFADARAVARLLKKALGGEP